MYIKIFNSLFWWIVAFAETWHQINPWIFPPSLPFKTKPNFQRLHQKMLLKQYTPRLLAPEPQEEEPQRTTKHYKCNCDASCKLAQKQVQYILQICKSKSNEICTLAKVNKTHCQLTNVTTKKSTISMSNHVMTTAAS